MLKRRTLFAGMAGATLAAQPIQEGRSDPTGGRFVRQYWYRPGLEHGNPFFNRRFRVNAPEAVLHPSYGGRSEVRSSGMMQILAEEELRHIEGAQLYLELWGGHPGTANKRVTLNGRSTYEIPEVGTAADHCTHQYPTIRLKVTDLVNGYNALQFACDTGKTFWGHFIVENACLRMVLPPGHAGLAKGGLSEFSAAVTATPWRPEQFSVSLKAEHAPEIERVEYEAFYEGYDENGNCLTRDWHGYTKQREPQAHLGTVTQPPFEMSWDTSMLPAQDGVAIRAKVYFKAMRDMVYETTPVGGLRIGEGRKAQVQLIGLSERPAEFWSRAKRKKSATLEVPIAPARIERAQLHTVVWDGGRGEVKDYFTLNGKQFDVAREGAHDVIYSVLPVELSLLRQGTNVIELLSDTEHHGIEVLEPGPALMLRTR